MIVGPSNTTIHLTHPIASFPFLSQSQIDTEVMSVKARRFKAEDGTLFGKGFGVEGRSESSSPILERIFAFEFFRCTSSALATVPSRLLGFVHDSQHPVHGVEKL